MSRHNVRAAWLGAVLIGLLGTSPAPAANWAESLFDEHSVDFGPIPRGVKVRHNFLLVNTLSEVVSVLDVRASCGCTTGRASAASVPPGGRAGIEAIMDTRNFIGPKATTLTVVLVTASGSQGEARFTVQANILPDVVLNPGSADFGMIARGQTPQQVITIERLGRPDWKFTRMIASEDLCRVIAADLTEKYRTGDGVGYSLTIRLKPDAPSGLLRGEIRLLTNDAETASVPVLVTAQVQCSLVASPAVLALGNVAASGTAQGRFILRGGQPFTVTGIEGDGDGFTLAPADPSAKALHVLTLTFRPEQSLARGDLRRTFRVTTSLPNEAPVELTATLRAAP